jgi:hypothetical protein
MSLNYKVVRTGSKGNHLILETLCIDMGKGVKDTEIPWSNIEVIYITHTHSDHWGTSHIKKALKLGIPVYMHKTNRRRKFNASGSKKSNNPVQELSADEKKLINWIEYGFKFEGVVNKYSITLTGMVPHNVPNFGLHIDIITLTETYKVFHLTDAGQYMQKDDNGKFTIPIVAPDKDYYFLETNYCKYRIAEVIEHLPPGAYNRFARSRSEHLSKQQTLDFYNKQKYDFKSTGKRSKLETLHHSAAVYA